MSVAHHDLEHGPGVKGLSIFPLAKSLRRLGALLSLLALAGCAAGSEPAEVRGADLESGLPARVPLPEEEAASTGPFGLDPDPTAVVRAPAAPDIDDDPKRLIGMGPQALYALLGKPQLVRREAPAQVWQYKGLACVFDVVLYQSDIDEAVTYVEARDGEGNRTPARPCLNELLRARLAPETS